MISKFFTLRVIEQNGISHKANWKERFIWLFSGRHLRDEKVVLRYQEMIKNHK